MHEIYYWKTHFRGILNRNYEVSKANMENSNVEAKLERTGATLFWSIGSSAGHAELNIITALHLQRFSADHVWILSEITLLLLKVLRQNKIKLYVGTWRQ